MLLKNKKRLTAYVVAALCVASTGFAATEHWNDASTTPTTVVATQAGDANWEQWKSSWKDIQDDYEQVSLTPGKDATQMNLAWYSKDKAKAAEVRISTNEDMSHARSFLGTSKTGTVIDDTQYYTNKVSVKDLKPDTTYYYQVKIDGQWRDAQSFKTGNPDDFTFMYVGDPQIGASKGQTSSEGNKQDGELATRNDAYNWNKTLNSALSQHPEINFLVSPGDQINEPAEDQSAAKIKLQEQQYAGYLSAKALRSLPEATSIGNHDSMTTGYQNHFNVPNPFTEETNPTKAGHGYYYTYGNALFIVINANNYNAADHEALIKKPSRPTRIRNGASSSCIRTSTAAASTTPIPTASCCARSSRRSTTQQDRRRPAGPRSHVRSHVSALERRQAACGLRGLQGQGPAGPAPQHPQRCPQGQLEERCL